jgi:hypothetical protein
MNRAAFQNRRAGFYILGGPLLTLFLASFAARLWAGQQTPPSPRVLGTIQAIHDKTLTVLSDSGPASKVSIEDTTKLLQIEPGKTDLKQATPLVFADLQPGDRVLVRGAMSDDGKTLRAASLIAMKKAAISEKQGKDRAEWQRGVGGLVKSFDPAAQTIVITTSGLSANQEIVLHLSNDTVLRRYAPDSTRFDEAKVAPLSALQVGDQLRARGRRNGDATSFEAAEVVSGTFHNVAGTITSTDASGNTLVVHDLATKSDFRLKVSGESQMRKLPPPFAERLAARLKGQAGDAPSSRDDAPTSPAPQPRQPDQGGGPANGAANRTGGELQQMLARMPAATLADLQKGDAVMVVTTQGTGKHSPIVITLLAGVEPILRASPKGAQDMILSPWTLGGGEPPAN